MMTTTQTLLFMEPAESLMKSRILAAFAQHGPLTYAGLISALNLMPSQCDFAFLVALVELVEPDRKLVRREGEAAGIQAFYRLAQGVNS
jgi:hypothetical protein